MSTDETHEVIRYTVDVVLLCGDSVLLIRRYWPPFADRWALPGGHVDRGETARQAAVRELREETGITVPANDLGLVGVYDEPGRDPRGRYVSVAFVAVVDFVSPVAGDDASSAR